MRRLLLLSLLLPALAFAQTPDPALDAQDFFRRADYAKAVPLLQQAIAADTANPALVTQLAYCYVRLGQLPVAKRTYESLLNRSGVDPREVLSQLAAISEKELNYSRALRYYRQLITLDSSVSFYHRQAGYLSSRLGNPVAATEYYRAALKLNPDDLDTIADLATLYLNDGLKDNLAEPLVKRGYRLDSNSVRVLQLRSRLNSRVNKFRDVIADVEKTMALGDSAVYFQRLLGVAYYSTEQYPKSIRTFQRLLNLGENTEAVHAGLGTAYLLEMKPISPDSAAKQFYWPAANGHFQKAIELGTSPKIIDYRMGIADAMEKIGQIDQAIRDYKWILSQSKAKRPKALYRLAQLHDRHRVDLDLAAIYYQELIDFCQKAKSPKPWDCDYATLAAKRLAQLKARPAQSVAKDTTRKD